MVEAPSILSTAAVLVATFGTTAVGGRSSPMIPTESPLAPVTSPGGFAPTIASTATSSKDVMTTLLHTLVDQNATTTLGNDNVTDVPVYSRIFLQTAAAQGIAGVFAWASILITCHQVGGHLKHYSYIKYVTISLRKKRKLKGDILLMIFSIRPTPQWPPAFNFTLVLLNRHTNHLQLSAIRPTQY